MVNGVVTDITLSGGNCTAEPTMTIVHPTTQAKAIVVENGAKTARVDEPGF